MTAQTYGPCTTCGAQITVTQSASVDLYTLGRPGALGDTAYRHTYGKDCTQPETGPFLATQFEMRDAGLSPVGYIFPTRREAEAWIAARPYHKSPYTVLSQAEFDALIPEQA